MTLSSMMGAAAMVAPSMTPQPADATTDANGGAAIEGVTGGTQPAAPRDAATDSEPEQIGELRAPAGNADTPTNSGHHVGPVETGKAAKARG